MEDNSVENKNLVKILIGIIIALILIIGFIIIGGGIYQFVSMKNKITKKVKPKPIKLRLKLKKSIHMKEDLQLLIWIIHLLK